MNLWRQIGALLLFLICSPCYPSDWNLVFNGINKNTFKFFDKDSIRYEGDIIGVWFETVNTTNPDSDGTWFEKAKIKADCKNKKLSITRIIKYDEKAIAIRSYDYQDDFKEPPPDSTGESTIDLVCSKNFPNNGNDKGFASLRGDDPFEFTKDVRKMSEKRSKN